jgi:LmbE family N-acetylglucosaminyl deacetylase
MLLGPPSVNVRAGGEGSLRRGGRRPEHMTVLYVLAHFDDEYCALPLIWEAQRQRLAQRFLYLAPPRAPRLAARRLAETRAFLARQGVPADQVRPIGAACGGFDGALYQAAASLETELLIEAQAAAPVERLVVPAWEGGHMDHDVCAALGARLAHRLGVGVRQFSLYNASGLPKPLLRAAAPLAANGPVERIPLRAAEWLRWSFGVRAFPSQLYAWSGIWPAMMWGLACRGFGWQALSAERVRQRPHAGPLFYERMFKVPYEEVRAALDALPAEPR